jgi:hypothetical protein
VRLAGSEKKSVGERTDIGDGRMPTVSVVTGTDPGNDGVVTTPSERLARKIRRSFPPGRVDEVMTRLSRLPDTSQSAERIQTAMIVKSGGSFERFMSEMELVQLDWRDTLMGSGLEHADYAAQLDHLLGPAE